MREQFHPPLSFTGRVPRRISPDYYPTKGYRDVAVCPRFSTHFHETYSFVKSTVLCTAITDNSGFRGREERASSR